MCSDLDRHLADQILIARSRYSLADVAWTVTVARAVMRGEAPLVERPNLEAWYERMCQRPSFRSAEIWERFAPWKLVPVLVMKLRLQLVVLFVLLTVGVIVLLNV